MKRLFLLPLVILLVCGFICASCAAPASAPTPAAAPAKPIKLKFSFAAPTRDLFYTDGFALWAEQLEQRTTAIGKPVEIVFYGGAALGPIRANQNRYY